MSNTYKKVPTPVGQLTLVAGEKGLAAILWENEPSADIELCRADEQNPVLQQAEQQLLEYFAGKRQSFSVPLAFEGTAFQRKVWDALLTIPYGATRSYADIAKQVGNAQAMRAVGAANGKNPIPIIAPCHRVIGASGKLTGFAGGLKTKAMLLDLEARLKN